MTKEEEQRLWQEDMEQIDWLFMFRNMMVDALKGRKFITMRIPVSDHHINMLHKIETRIRDDQFYRKHPHLKKDKPTP